MARSHLCSICFYSTKSEGFHHRTNGPSMLEVSARAVVANIGKGKRPWQPGTLLCVPHTLLPDPLHKQLEAASPGSSLALLILQCLVPLCFCFSLPLSEQVADGGVLGGERAGEERQEAPEALPQLLHLLLQGVDVGVQLAPTVLHLG